MTTYLNELHHQYKELCKALNIEWFSIDSNNWEAHYDRLQEKGR